MRKLAAKYEKVFTNNRNTWMVREFCSKNEKNTNMILIKSFIKSFISLDLNKFCIIFIINVGQFLYSDQKPWFFQIQPTVAWYYLAVAPKSIRKPKGFLKFSGGIAKQHRAVMS